MSEQTAQQTFATADDALAALDMGITPDQVAANRVSQGGTQPPPPPVQDTPVQPVQPTQAADPAQPQGTYDFSIFDGAKDFDEAKTKWGALSETGKKYSDLEKNHTELSGKWKQVEPILEVIPQMQNPYADSIVHKLDKFIRKSGLPQDETGASHKFALDILTITPEQIEKDPITAIAMQNALQNPGQSKMGMEGLKRIVMLENGLDADPENWTDDQKHLLKYKSIEAGDHIKEKKAEFDTKDDFFASLLSHREKAKGEVEKRSKEWETELPSVLSGIEGISQEVQIGEEKITVNAALSKEEVQGVLESIKPLLSQVNPDANGKALVKGEIQSALRSAYVSKLISEAIVSDRKTFHAAEAERLRKEQVNGGPIPRADTLPASVKGQPSPADLELDRLMGT